MCGMFVAFAILHAVGLVCIGGHAAAKSSTHIRAGTTSGGQPQASQACSLQSSHLLFVMVLANYFTKNDI